MREWNGMPMRLRTSTPAMASLKVSVTVFCLWQIYLIGSGNIKAWKRYGKRNKNEAVLDDVIVFARWQDRFSLLSLGFTL